MQLGREDQFLPVTDGSSERLPPVATRITSSGGEARDGLHPDPGSHEDGVVHARDVMLPLLLSGCFGNSATEFPPGLEPLEEDAVPAQPGGPYSETLVTAIEPF